VAENFTPASNNSDGARLRKHEPSSPAGVMMKNDEFDDAGSTGSADRTAGDSNPSGFGLEAPQAGSSKSFPPASGPAKRVPMPKPPPSTETERSKAMGWKGLEKEEEFEPEIDFKAEKSDDDEMDMTPMVDVTFLLLIFFMVTASFVTQRSIKQPKPSEDQPSTTVVEMEDQNDYVEVIIDQNNMYRITSRDDEEIEAPSDPEMRAQMRDAKERLNARKLIVTAHDECWHEKVVKAWDYGTTLGFEEIEIKTTTQNY
jgi:biopolymer transport protein ExbD